MQITLKGKAALCHLLLRLRTLYMKLILFIFSSSKIAILDEDDRGSYISYQKASKPKSLVPAPMESTPKLSVVETSTPKPSVAETSKSKVSTANL